LVDCGAFVAIITLGHSVLVTAAGLRVALVDCAGVAVVALQLAVTNACPVFTLVVQRTPTPIIADEGIIGRVGTYARGLTLIGGAWVVIVARALIDEAIAVVVHTIAHFQGSGARFASGEPLVRTDAQRLARPFCRLNGALRVEA